MVWSRMEGAPEGVGNSPARWPELQPLKQDWNIRQLDWPSEPSPWPLEQWQHAHHWPECFPVIFTTEAAFNLSDSILYMVIAWVVVKCSVIRLTRSQLRFITLKSEDPMVVLIIPLSDTGVLVSNMNCFVALMLTREGKLNKKGFVGVV